jgi:hypothetical protein
MGLEMSPFAIPAIHAQQHTLQKQNSTKLERIVPVLTITESMKLDGRAVLCLEVEAAAEEIPPTPQDTDLLRLLDLLLAIAVLLFCIVVGNFSTDVRTAGLVVAVGLAGVAVAGLKQHCGEALGTLTPRKRQTKKAPTQPSSGLLVSMSCCCSWCFIVNSDPCSKLRHMQAKVVFHVAQITACYTLLYCPATKDALTSYPYCAHACCGTCRWQRSMLSSACSWRWQQS